MLCSKSQPPWEFLLSASRTTLQSYELSRLSHAANLRKEIVALLDQWLEENACALVARCLLEQQEQPPRETESTAAAELPEENRRSVSHNFFADRRAAQTANRSSA